MPVRIRPKVGLKLQIHNCALSEASWVRIRPKVGLKRQHPEQAKVVAGASESDLR